MESEIIDVVANENASGELQEVYALIRKAKNGDAKAKSKMVESNMGLVHHIAQKFVGRGYDLEELIQVGSIGLLKAIANFEPERNLRFSTYAVPLILGEIRRFFRDDGPIKVSRCIKENAYLIWNCSREFVGKYGREPGMEEIMSLTGLDREDIVLAMESEREVESIYQTSKQKDGSEIMLLDKLTGTENENERLMDRILIGQISKNLEAEDRAIIRLRYYEQKTQAETAEKLGISQVQISRREKKILLQMRKEI